LSLQPIRNEVHAIDPNIEYLVAFEVSRILYFLCAQVFLS
jgi:hypothetical protein